MNLWKGWLEWLIVYTLQINLPLTLRRLSLASECKGWVLDFWEILGQMHQLCLEQIASVCLKCQFVSIYKYIFPNFYLTLLGQLNHIVETLNVNPDRQRDIVLPDTRQEGTEVNQPINPLVHNNFLQALEVQNICKNKRSLGQLLILRLDDIRQDDSLLSMQLPQFPSQTSAKLSQATSYQNTGRLGSLATAQPWEHLKIRYGIKNWMQVMKLREKR